MAFKYIYPLISSIKVKIKYKFVDFSKSLFLVRKIKAIILIITATISIQATSFSVKPFYNKFFINIIEIIPSDNLRKQNPNDSKTIFFNFDFIILSIIVIIIDFNYYY